MKSKAINISKEMNNIAPKYAVLNLSSLDIVIDDIDVINVSPEECVRVIESRDRGNYSYNGPRGRGFVMGPPDVSKVARGNDKVIITGIIIDPTTLSVLHTVSYSTVCDVTERKYIVPLDIDITLVTYDKDGDTLTTVLANTLA